MDERIPLSRMQDLVSARFLTEPRRSPTLDDEDDTSPHSTSLDNSSDFLATIHPTWKRDLHCLLERPTSSQSAFIIYVLTTGLIVLSAIVTVAETVETLHYVSPRLWFGLETSLVALFTVEYVSRLLAWSGTWMSLFKWVISFYGVIDLLAILPYYIEIMLRKDMSILFRFSILRMFRLLRVFRPFRSNHTILLTIEVMYVSVRRSRHALFAIGFFALFVVILFSTLLYFVERGTWDTTLNTFINSDGDPTQFASIPSAAWFVIVTITTVGYGEITPRSFLGRLFTLPLLMFGLLLIALPSFVLGREFSLVWERMTSDQNDMLNRPMSPPNLPSDSRPTPSQDLSNFKLAQNQTELSKQIQELKATVEMNGVVMRRLVDALEAQKN